MIHSDSHQINARWHGLPSWQRRLAPSSSRVSPQVRPNASARLPLTLPASHFHITYLVSLINFVLRLGSRSRSSILRRRYLPDTVDSRIEPSLTISPSSHCVFPLSRHIISVSLSPCLSRLRASNSSVVSSFVSLSLQCVLLDVACKYYGKSKDTWRALVRRSRF